MKQVEDIKTGDHFWYFEEYVGSGHQGCAQLWEAVKQFYHPGNGLWWECRVRAHTCGNEGKYSRLGRRTARMDYWMDGKRFLIWL